jgi:histidine triad (HIT) family protein
MPFWLIFGLLGWLAVAVWHVPERVVMLAGVICLGLFVTAYFLQVILRHTRCTHKRLAAKEKGLQIMSDCIFCRIAAKEVPADLVYEDDEVVAFRDLNPQAPVHLLVIPRKHLRGLDAAGPEDEAVLGRLALVAAQLAAQEGLGDSGYRVVVNNGRDAGQAVDHVHYHVIGGRKLTWPPG